MTIPFSVESKVRCRNQVWEVLKVADNTDGSWTVRLYPENGGKPQSFLFPHTPIEPISSALGHLQAGRIDHIDHYRLLTSATRLALVYEYDKLLSISNSKMIPEPYQLLAVKKVMESLRQRFLIADDVGLGKTIEAGLIMQELAARQRGDRVLIVVPAALQDQWKKEMQRHFLRSFYIYNSRKLEGIQELVDENLNPWLAKNSIITSIDWVKPQYQGTGAARRNINRIFDQLMKVEKRWELVIVDEAHYVSTDSNRADFAKAIQERCDSLLLLTATPHSGNPEHFFNLLNLIDPFMFAEPTALDRGDARERVDKVMIRRGKETVYEVNDDGDLVKKFRDRAPQSIEISYTEVEQGLYDAVSAYTGSGWAQLSRKRKISVADRNVGKFLLTLVQKRMVSSPAALRETLRRRIDSIVETRTLTRLDGRASGEVARLLKDYERGELLEDEDQELVERYIETRRVQAMYAERTSEIRTLRALLDKAAELLKTGQDSKLAWLRHFLQQLFAREPGEKVIIFTEYRDTLNYLKAQLEKAWFLGPESIVVIHGGMPLGDSEEEIGSKLHAERRFDEPDTRLLLATDAASEGLNLQQYCHILINYELPWNPNRLEQRIGRIHRYGQRHVARIYNLMIEGSKEAEIFRRLQDKIEIIRQQLGSMAEVLGVLERISLDDVILRVLDRSVDIADVGAIADAELKRLEEIAESIRKTQFLSGCRQFTREDIQAAEGAIEASQQAIPQHIVCLYYVFENVIVEPVVCIFECGSKAESCLCKVQLSPDGFGEEAYRTSLSRWENLPNQQFAAFTSEDAGQLFDKIVNQCVPLGEVSSVRAALQAYEVGKGTPPQSLEDVRDHVFDRNEKDSPNTHPYLDGANVQRYSIEWKSSWLSYGPWLSQPREISTFLEPRVLVREVTGRYPRMLIAAPTTELYLNNKSILNVICRPQSQYTPWVITGILNSKLGSFIFKHSGVKANRGLFPKVVIADLQKFPVPRTLKTSIAKELEAVVRSMCNHVRKTNGENQALQE